jgi:glycosyltransferase involved in cell wall biosynthesis
MKSKALSIIIPVYNVEDYLAESLDSVFSQNLDNCEVICVNDGSLDNSRKILADYQKKYPDMVIVDRENGGLSAARNSGLEVAQGEYIYFLDSDDYLLDGALPEALTFAAGQSLDIACFNVKIDDNLFYFTETKRLQGILPGKAYYPDYYRVNGFFPPSAVWMHIYRRNFLEKNQLRFKNGALHEDEEFSPKAFYLAERVAGLNIPVQFHRVLREGAITATLNDRNLLDLLDNMKSVFLFFKEERVEENLFYHKIFEVYFAVGKRIADNHWKKMRFFVRDDFVRMKACVTGWEWYAYYWLFRHASPVFKWYVSGNSVLVIKKIMNTVFKYSYPYIIKA